VRGWRRRAGAHGTALVIARGTHGSTKHLSVGIGGSASDLARALGFQALTVFWEGRPVHPEARLCALGLQPGDSCILRRPSQALLRGGGGMALTKYSQGRALLPLPSLQMASPHPRQERSRRRKTNGRR